MARLRVGGVKPQVDANYVPPDVELVPAHLADLEKIPGRCWSRDIVVQCTQPAPNVVCLDCAMAELGEHWSDFKARTNAGLTRAAYDRKLGAEQRDPDPQFARSQEWARQRRLA